MHISKAFIFIPFISMPYSNIDILKKTLVNIYSWPLILMLFRPHSYLFLINNIYNDLAYKIRTYHSDISLLSW